MRRSGETFIHLITTASAWVTRSHHDPHPPASRAHIDARRQLDLCGQRLVRPTGRFRFALSVVEAELQLATGLKLPTTNHPHFRRFPHNTRWRGPEQLCDSTSCLALAVDVDRVGAGGAMRDMLRTFCPVTDVIRAAAENQRTRVAVRGLAGLWLNCEAASTPFKLYKQPRRHRSRGRGRSWFRQWARTRGVGYFTAAASFLALLARCRRATFCRILPRGAELRGPGD